MLRYLAPLLLFCFLVLSPHAQASSFTLNANLSALPGVETSGFGFGSVTVSDDQLSAFVSLFVSGLNGDVSSGTGIFGPGPSGPLVLTLPVPFPSFTAGILSSTFELPTGVLGELLTDQLYFVVYTNGSPEIGGQITTPEPSAMGIAGFGLAVIGLGTWWRQSRARSEGWARPVR